MFAAGRDAAQDFRLPILSGLKYSRLFNYAGHKAASTMLEAYGVEPSRRQCPPPACPVAEICRKQLRGRWPEKGLKSDSG